MTRHCRSLHTESHIFKKEHFLLFSYNLTPNHYLIATQNSLGDRGSPRASWEWGLGITRQQTVAEKEIANEVFLVWNFVFLTSCRRLSYQVVVLNFFWEGYFVAISSNVLIALTIEMFSVGLLPVNFSTRTEDWKTEPTFAAWTWSADRPILTPVLLIGMHAWFQEVSDIKTPRIPSKVACWIDSNFRTIFDFLWFVRRIIVSQRIDHFGSTRAKTQNNKGTLSIVYIC